MNAPAPAVQQTSTPEHKSGPDNVVKPLDPAAVTKRLQQELTSMMCSGDSGVSAFPAGDSLFQWIGTITVSKNPV